MTSAKPKFKVVVQKPSGVTYDLGEASYKLEREALDPIGAEIVEIDAKTDEDYIRGARDADAVIARGRRLNRKIIMGLDNCKIIACGSVGLDGVDVQAATEKGIVVTNVPDLFVEEVADHTMTLILACARRIVLMDKLVREGRWSEGRPMFNTIPRLLGQTLGFISFGNIPRAVARKAKVFGFHMLAYDPYVNETIMVDHGVEPVVTLEELLERSDYISMHVPGTAGTVKMLKEEHFRRMKKTAIFINNGRGPTVDEAALIKALQEGWIAGAGLDVLEKEPPDLENPLLHMDNVILTPHIASASSRMMPETRRRVGYEIAAVLKGQWPRNPINPYVLQKKGIYPWQPLYYDRGPAIFP